MLALRLVAYYLIPLCSEDAYISFHAAIDPAWHAATTSPLYALSLSWADPPTLARLFALLADCVAVWAASRVLGVWGFGAFVALWVSPFFTGSAVSGLETHLVACALIAAQVTPWGYAVAAALRPDAALLSLLVAGRRWRWVLCGTLVLGLLGVAYTGWAIPQTIFSKAQVYGWQGLRLFWWYSVPPLALGLFWLCRSIRRPWQLAVALAVIAWFVPGQYAALHERTIQERNLWAAGMKLAQLRPTGAILLEPAGMIPYQNPQLRVIDDVGLLTPWMAARRNSIGWRTAALDRYRPEWVVMRLREYLYAKQWSVGPASPYFSPAEETLPGYRVVSVPGIRQLGGGRVAIQFKSSNLIILRRK